MDAKDEAEHGLTVTQDSRAIAHHLTDQITMVEAQHNRRYLRLRRTSRVALAVLAATVMVLLVSLVLVTAG
ncbi:hypothetical protein [Streptomyces sp. NPDC016675]|jgi:hypothetical protein|uniref:hypothetical protein n=1 Tax=Streptomyces sp. NPDC016675 TaxID=3364970 RepID=UPI0037012E52